MTIQDFVQIKNKLPKYIWAELSDYLRFAYCKDFIPMSPEYWKDLRLLKEFLNY